MPLIILTGSPCSGKTYRAQQIADSLAQRIAEDAASSKRSIRVIYSKHALLDTSSKTDDTVDTLRDQIYTSAAREKTARAEEFSAIKRALSKDNVVIADGLNYIKGYRYQLWCEAKAAGTRCCVVHVAAQEDECKQWNAARLRAAGREAAIEEQAPIPSDKGGKQGKDVLGDLMPESHTGIYGDRVVEESRSRSSSVEALDNGDRPQPEDTMTLKSLYISDKIDTSKISPSINDQDTQNINIDYLPPTPIPPPSSAHPYAPSTLTSLIMRYEPPSPFSRWDTPLFTVPTTDAHPPYTSIYASIFPPPSKSTSKKALSQLPPKGQSPATTPVDTVRQHAATQLPQATSSSALQLLESTTLDVVKILLSSARAQNVADGDGGVVTLLIPLSAQGEQTLEMSLEISPGTTLSQPLLQRLRRKYTQMQRAVLAHGREYVGMREGREGIIRGFVGFLGGELGGED